MSSFSNSLALGKQRWGHLVVHCKKSRFDVYIGRASKGMPKGQSSAEWGNPFVMKDQSEAERDRVVAEYENWLRSKPELMVKARLELRGKVLACWCSPSSCHGHILAAIANEEEDGGDCKPCGSSEVTMDPRSCGLVDIGINLTNSQLIRSWKGVVQRAVDAGLRNVLLTGASLKSSKASIALAREWLGESGQPFLRCTVGVHPHDAKTFNAETVTAMRELLQDPLVVAVGECGLDFNRNFSPRDSQLTAFERQVELACELQMPLFVHEREAHNDLIRILDKFSGRLPPVVVHCFTGELAEAQAYVQRGFYVGFTGTICKHERGAPLRELIAHLPLNRLLLETDAPFMGFVKGRQNSEPADVVKVAETVARCMRVSFEEVCRVTTHSAVEFFRLNRAMTESIAKEPEVKLVC